jgi:hypothetical protein
MAGNQTPRPTNLTINLFRYPSERDSSIAREAKGS